MIVDSALYRAGTRVDLHCGPDDFGSLRAGIENPGDFVWLGLYQPSLHELDVVAEAFGLHALAVEDAVKAHQRPKLERYEDSLFLVLKTLWYVDAEDAVETGEINIFLGPDFVVTVRHGAGSQLQHARAQLEAEPSLLGHGPGAVAYAVCDTVVDGYLDVMGELEIDVDEVETSVFSAERTKDSERIYTLKRELAEVRRAVQPLREPMRRLAGGEVTTVSERARPFFRDVLDHLTQANDICENLETLLSSAFEAHLAQISVQQNDDMRKISAGAALVVVPTLIAGIYGMNFERMPELEWTLGYPFALVLMASVAGCLWFWFKRSGWL